MQSMTYSCENYNATTNSALRMNLTSGFTNVNMIYATCPSGQGPIPVTFSLTTGISQVCAVLLANGAACTSSYMCSSGFCILGACNNPVTSGSCLSDLDTADGYYCKGGSVVASLAMGATCTGNYLAECKGGYCNPANMQCDTYTNAAGSYVTKLKLPALQGGDANGFHTCSASTVDSDCQYLMADKSIQKASVAGAKCIPTITAPTVTNYCQMGGGEQIYMTWFKYVTYKYIHSF